MPLVQRYQKNGDIADKVFKLPFVFLPKKLQKKMMVSPEKQIQKNSKAGCKKKYRSDVIPISFISNDKTSTEPWVYENERTSPSHL